MTIALKIGDRDSQVQGFIYLDAVTSYTKDMDGKVTSFPADSGVNISDHFIAQNQKFTIEGVVSDVDITGLSDKVMVDGEKPVNAKPQPTATRISGQQSALQYLPSAVKQFFERSGATVGSDAFSQASIPAVELLFEELMRGTYYNSADNRWRNKMTTTTLYEMDGANFSNAKTDLVITNVSISEDADSGDALHLSISLEKVRFATLEMTDVKNVKTNSQKKVTGTSNKGNPAISSGTSNTNNSANPAAPSSTNHFQTELEKLRRMRGN